MNARMQLTDDQLESMWGEHAAIATAGSRRIAYGRAVQDAVNSMWLVALQRSDVWQPIATAPRDGTPIIGWCVHEADPYFDHVANRLTVYGAHAEGAGRVVDGPHIVAWGGAFDDSTYEYAGASLPDWWFEHDSDFGEAANPIFWLPLPLPPTLSNP